MIFSSQFHLKQSVTAITTMKNGVALKAIAVSVMIKMAIQGFCIHTQVSHGHVLKKKSKRIFAVCTLPSHYCLGCRDTALIANQ